LLQNLRFNFNLSLLKYANRQLSPLWIIEYICGVSLVLHIIGQYTTDVIFFCGIIKATRVTFVYSLLHCSFFISHNLSPLSFSASIRIMSTSNSSLTPNTQPANLYKHTPNKRTKTGTTPVSISPDDTSGSTLGTSVGTPVGDKPLTSIKKRKEGPVQPRLTQLGFTSEGKSVRGCLCCLLKL
jgi:hypothetical protein